MWSKATKKERKELVVLEVIRMEDETYKIKEDGQTGRQSPKVVITWVDMWMIPQATLSFLIRSIYDTLPSHQNIYLWYGLETNCSLCAAQNPNLQLSFDSWPVQMAAPPSANRASLSFSKPQIHFIRQGAEAENINRRECQDSNHGRTQCAVGRSDGGSL